MILLRNWLLNLQKQMVLMKTKTKKIKSDYYLTFLKKENDLNKILKAHKKDPRKLKILFVSLWDDYCTELVDSLKKQEVNSSKKQPLYIVDSFHMPHSFVIYKTNKVPQLVKIDKHKVYTEDYLPKIYESLGIE